SAMLHILQLPALSIALPIARDPVPHCSSMHLSCLRIIVPAGSLQDTPLYPYLHPPRSRLSLQAHPLYCTMPNAPPSLPPPVDSATSTGSSSPILPLPQVPTGHNRPRQVCQMPSSAISDSRSPHPLHSTDVTDSPTTGISPDRGTDAHQ